MLLNWLIPNLFQKLLNSVSGDGAVWLLRLLFLSIFLGLGRLDWLGFLLAYWLVDLLLISLLMGFLPFQYLLHYALQLLAILLLLLLRLQPLLLGGLSHFLLLFLLAHADEERIAIVEHVDDLLSMRKQESVLGDALDAMPIYECSRFFLIVVLADD
jgi:hypothetical protein